MSRALFLIAAIHLLATIAVADSAGPNNTGTGQNVVVSGDVNWSNPTNIYSSNDSHATFDGSNGVSQDLRATNFGFSIPSEATISGIVVEIERKANSSQSTGSGKRVEDISVRILKGGTKTGNDYAKTGAANRWPTTDTVASYGTSTTDLWGTTWTHSDINASNFGVSLAAQGNYQGGDGLETGSVDHIKITVYYTLSSGSVTKAAAFLQFLE